MRHSEFNDFKHGLEVSEPSDEGRVFLKKAWEQMRWIRYFETQVMERYKPPHLTRCPIHYCIGQEGVPAYVGLLRSDGSKSNLKNDGDYLFCNHRNHGYYLSWMNEGLSLLKELMGKESAPNKGRAGSQEISNHGQQFYSGAILSTIIGIAVGAAFAIQKNEKKIIRKVGDYGPVVFCTFGDGAADEGIFWEAMNIIALNKLPMVLICENNGYATFSAQYRRQATGIRERVAAFGVFAGFAKTYPLGERLKCAVHLVRSRRLPFFLEHFTYRHCGHVGAHNDDDQGYRTVDERGIWMQNDDLTVLEEDLLRAKVISPEDKLSLQKTHIETFNNIWEAAAASDDALPIDYSNATMPGDLDSAIPYEDDYSPEEFLAAILNPY